MSNNFKRQLPFTNFQFCSRQNSWYGTYSPSVNSFKTWAINNDFRALKTVSVELWFVLETKWNTYDLLVFMLGVTLKLREEYNQRSCNVSKMRSESWTADAIRVCRSEHPRTKRHSDDGPKRSVIHHGSLGGLPEIICWETEINENSKY